MPARVVDAGEVSINGVYYPINRPVQNTLASIYPAKVVIGDTTRDSQQRASVLAMSGWQGGIGIERMSGANEVDRAWWSTCNLRHHNHLVLPKLATLTADLGTPNTSAIGAIASYANEVYVAFGTAVHKYNNSTDSWGASLKTLPAAATDAVVAKIGGTDYLIFATTSGYTYFNGSTWTDDTDDAKYLTVWDNKLYFIDADGQLGHTTAAVIGTDTTTTDEIVPVEDGSVTDLLVAGDSNNAPIVYALAKDGLFAHDSSNNKFIKTNADLAIHPNLGEGSLHWRGSMFIPAGLSIYRYTTGPTAVTSLVGPDLDDGLPNGHQGRIQRLVGSHNSLIAAITTADSGPTAQDTFSASTPFDTAIIPASTVGRASILSWNETGWQVEWTTSETNKTLDYAHVSRAYSEYRLWWAFNKRIYYIDLPQNIINPNQVRSTKYALTGEHITPWFDAGQVEVDKAALEVRVDCSRMSATENIQLSYGLNYDEDNFTDLGTITTSGVTTFLLPNATTPKGVTFRSWRFKAVLNRGTDNTLSPDLVALTLIYRKKLPVKQGFTVDVSMNREYKGNTPMQLRAAMQAAIESSTLVEFTYRDDDGNDRNYYVDIASASGLENTGHDERGNVQVLLVEP